MGIVTILREAWRWIDFVARIIIAIPLMAFIIFLAFLCEIEDRLRGIKDGQD